MSHTQQFRPCESGTPFQKLAVGLIEDSIHQVNLAVNRKKFTPIGRTSAFFLLGRAGDIRFWLDVAGVKKHKDLLAGCKGIGERYLAAEEQARKKTKRQPYKKIQESRRGVCQ